MKSTKVYIVQKGRFGYEATITIDNNQVEIKGLKDQKALLSAPLTQVKLGSSSEGNFFLKDNQATVYFRQYVPKRLILTIGLVGLALLIGLALEAIFASHKPNPTATIGGILALLAITGSWLGSKYHLKRSFLDSFVPATAQENTSAVDPNAGIDQKAGKALKWIFYPIIVLIVGAIPALIIVSLVLRLLKH